MPIYPKNKTNLGQTKNISGKFPSGEPKFLVYHYTAGDDGMDSAKFLFGPHTPGSSAHFVVERNGDVIQISDTSTITWHAGKSSWKGIEFLNGHAIGIELANYGYWRPGISPKTADAAEKAGWVRAKHKNGGPELLWEPYPEAQILSAMALGQWVLEKHPTIREIVGHDDIAPKRKTDPGPAFPMKRFQDLISPRSLSGSDAQSTMIMQYSVNASSVNLREGPDTTFAITGNLKRGTSVLLINEKGDWSFIKFGSEKSAKEGWVYSQYLTPT